MGSIDSGLPPIIPDMVKPEFRAAVGGNALDRPTFGEKFKMFMAKMGSIIGKIGGAIGPFFGPFGMVGSAASYGLSRFSDRMAANMLAKRQANADLDLAASSMAGQGTAGVAPGFDFSSPMGGGTGNTGIEVAPFARGYEQGIETTLNNKGQAAIEAVGGMGGGAL